MAAERYPGESKGLRLFLEELLPVLARVGGQHALLRHAIRRALESGDLHHLRHARQLFNNLPRSQRQALSAALLDPRRPDRTPPEAPAPGRPEPASGRPEPAFSRPEPVPTVRFETPRESDPERPLRVELCHEPPPAAPVTVTIEAGTLPSVAIDALRRIAATLEADRRLLSARFWLKEGGPDDGQRDVR
jgi:hypothetical protein